MNDFSPGLSVFFKRAASLPLLTAVEEAALGRRALRGDAAARNKLIEHNLRFAIKVAKGYRGKGIPFEDLVQHATLGLHKAATKFDPDKGFRFTTYAMWWIHRHLQGAVYNEGTTIRTPGHISIRRAKIRAALEKNPEATAEELAIIADCKPHHVEEALNAARVVSSLDAPTSFSDDDGGSAYDHIPDPTAVMPGDLEEMMQSGQLRSALEQLDPLERRVIELRFGFADGNVMSRDDVARRLNTEPHAVGQAQKRALAKLRGIFLTEDRNEDASPIDRRGLHLLHPDSALVPTCSRPQPKELK